MRRTAASLSQEGQGDGNGMGQGGHHLRGWEGSGMQTLRVGIEGIQVFNLVSTVNLLLFSYLLSAAFCDSAALSLIGHNNSAKNHANSMILKFLWHHFITAKNLHSSEFNYFISLLSYSYFYVCSC